jgi:DNA polymerase (family 10)
VVEVSVAGSLRRWEETVDVIDLVASANNPAAVIESSCSFHLILSSQRRGPNECVAQFADGAQVSLTAVPPKEFAVTLFVKTGSQAHLEKVMETTRSERR